jgi:hypothetical protein
MNVVSYRRRVGRRVKCSCCDAFAAHRLARGVSVAACPDCGQWFMVSHLPAPRRFADLLLIHAP